MGFFCLIQKKPRISEALYQERESNLPLKIYF